MATYTSPAAGNWAGISPGWIWNDIALTAGLVQHDTLIFLSTNNFGWRIADWAVAMPQVDSNVSPTITFDVGFINNSGNALETGLEWEQGLAIGQASTGDFVRASKINHTTSFGRGRRIGLHVATSPATAVYSGKTIRMGLLLLPV